MKRDYFYEVDRNGQVWLDGALQDDPFFLDLLYRKMAITANPMYADYPFVSRCGEETNYIRPDDTIVVFQRYADGRLWFTPGMSIAFDPAELSTTDGILYHTAPVGDRGRVVSRVLQELSTSIVPFGPVHAWEQDGVRTPIPETTLPTIRILRSRPDNTCIGCGADNPWSFRLPFLVDDATAVVSTWVCPDARWQGAMGTVHGGLVSLLMDETMGKALSAQSIKAPTARLTVNFRSPMAIGIEHHCQAWIEERNGRKHMLRGVIHRADNPTTIVADAEALFIQRREQTVLPHPIDTNIDPT